MAIVDWQEIHNERRGELDNFRATRRYQRTFRVVTDDMLDGPAEIFTETQLPGWLAPYQDANGTGDMGAVLKTIRIDQDSENPFVWLVRCEFSSEDMDVQQQSQEQNPLLRPPIWSLETSEFQRVLNWDITGTPVQNSAGVPFSPLPEYDDSRFVLTCERNEAQPDWQTLLTYRDAVNSDVFLGFAPGVFKIKFRAQSMYENGLYYWKMTYLFHGRAYVTINGQQYSDWDVHLLDQGLMQLDANGVLVDIYDKQGVPISEPTKLDGSGHAYMSAGVLNPNASYGVTSLQLTNGGYNYDVSKGPPTISFSGGGGTGAAAVAFTGNQPSYAGKPYDPQHQQIIALQLTNPGSGYTSAPTVTISAPGAGGGNKAQATATAAIGILPRYVHYRPYNWLPFSVFGFSGSIT